MKIVIYILPGCPYCTRATELLDAHDLPYDEKTVARSRKGYYKRLLGTETFPFIQLVSGDKIYQIGGCDDLEELLGRVPKPATLGRIAKMMDTEYSFNVLGYEDCPYSAEAVAVLRDLGLNYRTEWVDRSNSQEWKERLGVETFPYITFVRGDTSTVIGGADDLKKLLYIAQEVFATPNNSEIDAEDVEGTVELIRAYKDNLAESAAYRQIQNLAENLDK